MLHFLGDICSTRFQWWVQTQNVIETLPQILMHNLRDISCSISWCIMWKIAMISKFFLCRFERATETINNAEWNYRQPG